VAPRQIYACFDGGNTYRRSIYAEYKQKRRDRDSEIDDVVKKKADQFVANLRERYDMAFASHIVHQMAKNKLLKDEDLTKLLDQDG
jgi:5'-3' exonuclease